MNNSIEIDNKINWKPYYYRNYKSKIEKHLLCFPDHFNGNHRVLFNIFLYRLVDFVVNILNYILYVIIMIVKLLYVEKFLNVIRIMILMK